MRKKSFGLIGKSSLVSRNVTILGKRTSVRLEPDMWRELKNISKREACSIHELCSLISLRKAENTSLTAAIRVFLMLYFRAAATENGHQQAGHGDFESMKRRAGVVEHWFRLNGKYQSANQDDAQKNDGQKNGAQISDRLAVHLPASSDNIGQSAG